ncbi:hypothetical protein Lal_00005205 [Lupinus albus]|nr:hypothetical protein Lal_00005205 [Lupinus albus]
MDGFEANEGVILIAATNRPDVLDPALLRPGRFDRQVVVPNPDVLGREKILKVHMRKVPLSPDVDAKVIARGTPGFSGADLANLVNEAALLAARIGKRVVGMSEFENAKDKVMMGAERRSMRPGPQGHHHPARPCAGHGDAPAGRRPHQPVAGQAAGRPDRRHGRPHRRGADLRQGAGDHRRFGRHQDGDRDVAPHGDGVGHEREARPAALRRADAGGVPGPLGDPAQEHVRPHGPAGRRGNPPHRGRELRPRPDDPDREHRPAAHPGQGPAGVRDAERRRDQPSAARRTDPARRRARDDGRPAASDHRLRPPLLRSAQHRAGERRHGSGTAGHLRARERALLLAAAVQRHVELAQQLLHAFEVQLARRRVLHAAGVEMGDAGQRGHAVAEQPVARPDAAQIVAERLRLAGHEAAEGGFVVRQDGADVQQRRLQQLAHLLDVHQQLGLVGLVHADVDRDALARLQPGQDGARARGDAAQLVLVEGRALPGAEDGVGLRPLDAEGGDEQAGLFQVGVPDRLQEAFDASGAALAARQRLADDRLDAGADQAAELVVLLVGDQPVARIDVDLLRLEAGLQQEGIERRDVVDHRQHLQVADDTVFLRAVLQAELLFQKRFGVAAAQVNGDAAGFRRTGVVRHVDPGFDRALAALQILVLGDGIAAVVIAVVEVRVLEQDAVVQALSLEHALLFGDLARDGDEIHRHAGPAIKDLLKDRRNRVHFLASAHEYYPIPRIFLKS